MKLTPEQRRSRIYEIAETDKGYLKAKAQLEHEQSRFTLFTNKLPGFLRNFLWCYPGMLYLTHHRLLDVICEKMVFTDE